MKTLFAAVVALSLCSAALAAPEAAAPAAPSKQQTKMKTCNVEAGAIKGDERKAFMKTCLSAAPIKAVTPQQGKMKTCNVDAGAKKGDERKAFMKACLSAPKV